MLAFVSLLEEKLLPALVRGEQRKTIKQMYHYMDKTIGTHLCVASLQKIYIFFLRIFVLFSSINIYKLHLLDK